MAVGNPHSDRWHFKNPQSFFVRINQLINPRKLKATLQLPRASRLTHTTEKEQPPRDPS